MYFLAIRNLALWVVTFIWKRLSLWVNNRQRVLGFIKFLLFLQQVLRLHRMHVVKHEVFLVLFVTVGIVRFFIAVLRSFTFFDPASAFQSFAPASIACRWQDWRYAVLREIDFLLKICDWFFAWFTCGVKLLGHCGVGLQLILTWLNVLLYYKRISTKKYGSLVGRTSSFCGEYSHLFIHKLCAFLG